MKKKRQTELSEGTVQEGLTESEEIDQKMTQLMMVQAEKGKKKGKIKRKKKVIFLLTAGVVVLGISCGKLMGGRGEQGTPVTVTPLVREKIQEKITLSGPVSGTDSVDVVSNIHAEILSMDVKEGDQVAKGQVLAVLDSTDLEREVEIAQNSYDLALANKQEKDREAALGYEKAVQDYQKASLDHARNSQLFASGDLSQMDLEQSLNSLNDARRQMEGYTVENGRGTADPSYGIQIENAAFELEKKKEELENTQIKSTIDGTVVRVNSKVGQFADKVEDDKPILSIENLEALELEIQVSEFSIGKIQVGQKAVISADILNGQTAEGEVIKISPTGEEKGGGSTERVIPIIIQIKGENTKLIAGITAKAEILVEEAEDAFVVPAAALFEDGEITYIAVAENGKVRRIPVTTGVDGDLSVQVIPAEGEILTEGMSVITNPGAHLIDGMEVISIQQ